MTSTALTTALETIAEIDPNASAFVVKNDKGKTLTIVSSATGLALDAFALRTVIRDYERAAN